MEERLKVIKENFKEELCPVVSVMKNIMSFFSYNVQSLDLYGFGNGYVLTYPFQFTESQRLRGMFRYAREMCYANGSWYIEYITSDRASFLSELNDKWDEWVNAHQPMPIFVVLPERESGLPMSYILVGLDKQHENYDFIDYKGNVLNITKKAMEAMEAEEYGYATFHAPNNFLVKFKYYRDINRSLESTLLKAGYNIVNSSYTLTIFHSLIKYCKENNTDQVRNILLRIALNVKASKDSFYLFRKEYGEFLQAAAKEINKPQLLALGKEYIEAGHMWMDILGKNKAMAKVEYNRIMDVCNKEILLANKLLEI